MTTPTVLLKDIVDALEMQIDGAPSYVDLTTGKVEMITEDLLSLAEDDDDDEAEDPDRQMDDQELLARRFVSTGGDFLRLPSKFEVHDWSIMEDFAHSVGSHRIREQLLHALHGAGAFRHFKFAVRQHRIEKDWYAFRAEALKRIAIDWCGENGLAWK